MSFLYSLTYTAMTKAYPLYIGEDFMARPWWMTQKKKKKTTAVRGSLTLWWRDKNKNFAIQFIYKGKFQRKCSVFKLYFIWGDNFILINTLNQLQCKMQTKHRLYFDRYQSI